MADIRQHLRTFRGWQGGNAVSKPRHPLISLKIYRTAWEIWYSAARALLIVPNFLAALDAVSAKISVKQGVALMRRFSATLRLPATLIPVLRLISLRIYACVIGERGSHPWSSVCD